MTGVAVTSIWLPVGFEYEVPTRCSRTAASRSTEEWETPTPTNLSRTSAWEDILGRHDPAVSSGEATECFFRRSHPGNRYSNRR